MGCRSCRCLPCIICEPKSSFGDLGYTMQAEIAGIAALPGSPFPVLCPPCNGTFTLDGTGFDFIDRINMNLAMCDGAVDPDAGFNSGEVPNLCADSTYRTYCHFTYTSGNNRVYAMFYGTTGGGLSCLVACVLPNSHLAYSNVVLSASGRRIDCSTLDFTATSFTVISVAFGTQYCDVPTSIRISKV